MLRPAGRALGQSGNYGYEACDPSTATGDCTFKGRHESTDGRPRIPDETGKFFMPFRAAADAL